MKITLSRLTNDFSMFLPIDKSSNYLPPKIKAYSYRSDIYHEKMIENIVKVSLNKIAYKISNNEEKNHEKLKASDLDLNEKRKLINKLEKRTNRNIIICYS